MEKTQKKIIPPFVGSNGRYYVNYSDEDNKIIVKNFRDQEDADIYYKNLINNN